MKSDREKWDQRYSAEPNDIPAPDPFLVQHRNLLNTGRALDLACGRGGNAVFLAERGYRVDAVDISFVALSRLQAEADRKGLDIDCVVSDLDDFWLPESFYELVVVFYFFSESLVHGIKDTLKPGGLLFYSTFNLRHTSVQPGFNPDYLVEPEALGRYFTEFEILIHEPEAGEDRNISRFIGKRRAQ